MFLDNILRIFAACLAHNEANALASNGERPLIITHNGASGVYAGCTDLAYQQAVKDGADIIDCSVRMSKDGVAFCLGSADLIASTTAATTFMTKVVTISEIQSKSGIFSFDLSWSEIQTLKRKEQNNYIISSCILSLSCTNILFFCSSDQPSLLVHLLRQA